jgi:acyl carrier protein
LPEVPGDELAEMRTLGEIVAHLQSKLGTDDSALQTAGTLTSEITAAASAASSLGVSAEVVTAAMMTIVSEKTGYPQEMLEPGMDMESDLGIDSIKRVEILGSIQDKIPALPEVQGNELAEMRTLGQIIDHLKGKIGGDVSEAASDAPTTVATPDLASAPQFSAAVTGQDPGMVFMSIISEKTGYPAEMLELGMDMEADLGIDSIKRVEIMWSLQEQFKELPQIGANEVAELRTLKEIVDHLSSLAPSATARTTLIPAPVSTDSDSVKKKLLNPKSEFSVPEHQVTLGLAHVVPLAPPDVLHAELPENPLCLITDDGSSLAPVLAKALSEQGWSPVILCFSGLCV